MARMKVEGMGVGIWGNYSKGVTCEEMGLKPFYNPPPQGSAIGPLIFLLFVNCRPDAIVAMPLLFVKDAKVLTHRAHKRCLLDLLNAAWDWSEKLILAIDRHIFGR